MLAFTTPFFLFRHMYTKGPIWGGGGDRGYEIPFICGCPWSSEDIFMGARLAVSGLKGKSFKTEFI